MSSQADLKKGSWRKWSLKVSYIVPCSLSSKSARVDGEYRVQAIAVTLLCAVQGQLVEDDSGSVLLPAKYDIANIHF